MWDILLQCWNELRETVFMSSMEWSHLLCQKPNLRRAWVNFSYQAQEVCLRPYNALWSLHTSVVSLCSELGGWVIKISSWREPLRNKIIYINLLHLQMIDQSKYEDNLNCSRFGHWRESLIEVETKLLMIVLDYKSSLVFVHRTIRGFFHHECPFTPKKFPIRWEGGEGPSLVV